jgi:hypothetical protein
MVAAAAIVVVVIVMALLIHGCEVSQSNSSLKNYAANVDTLMTASNNNGAKMFGYLEDGELSSASGEQTLQQQLNTVLRNAGLELAQAKGYSAPGQLSGAQSALVEVMELRYDGIGDVASNIQGAAAKSTSKTAVGDIARGMYELVGSDVTYKTFVATALAKALNHAGIIIGGTSGAQIFGGQIINDLGWTDTRFVGEKIGADLPSSVVNTIVSGAVQGHILNSVSVSNTQLSEYTTNDIPASPAPTFTLNFTNGGTVEEYDVECKVTVDGLSDVGTAIVPETKPGQTTTCSVTLPTPPTASVFHVTARILKVPGEKNLSDNVMTFPVDFS